MTYNEQILLGILQQLRGQVGHLSQVVKDLQSNITSSSGGYLVAANNLSDIPNPVSARSNLLLGTLSTKNTLVAGDIPDISATYATQTNLATTNSNVTTLTTNLGTANTNIANNTTNITANTASIATNTTKINGILYTPTAVKTSSYTAAVGDLVKTDATSGTVPITLPTAPADKSRILVKMITTSGSNTTTVTTGGSDVFNKAGGGNSLSLTLLNQAVTLQYDSSLAVWLVIGDDIPLSQLDVRYLTPSSTSTLTNKSISGSTNTLTAIPNSALTNSTISGIALGSNLANLTATDTTLTFSVTYNGSAAATAGINLGNSNTWTNTKTIFSASPSGVTTNGVLNLGSAPFDGVTTGFFNGSSSGTYLAINAPNGYGGRFIECESFGTLKSYIDATGTAIFVNRLGIGSTTSPTASIHSTTAAISNSATYSSGGFGLRVDNATVTSTSSSGTIATGVMNSFGNPTFAASSATTITTAATVYIGGQPSAGTNVTITNAYSLYIPFGNVLFSNNLTVNRLTLALATFSTSAIATTSGSLLSISALTVTDNITASSGTVTHGVANAIAPTTIAASNTSVTYTNASTFYIGGAPTAGTNVTMTNKWALFVSAGDINSGGKIFMGDVIQLKGYTVATLPTVATGARAYVTDANAPTYKATVAGGGSTVVPVFYNGAAWICA